ncbi:uncharacterized protein LOC131665066 [Phymastichus coffea]|uniref:uncharacterized protein LOC131665066 n=1 Tax=Phymastichus coffea TaxID=108790 RepID=UPI00273B25E7|nr:uncharacterized protein LOC131665066 [Phymastichus coffea]
MHLLRGTCQVTLVTTYRRRRAYDNSSSRVSRCSAQLILGLGTPLQLERESAIVGAFAKMIYALPSNATADSTEADARRASRSRWSLYRSVAQLAELYGFGEGRACVLRGICEAAAAPFDAHHGLLHQLLQTFLSPSSSEEEYEQYQDREYHAAERLGGRLEDRSGCHALYPECRASLLDVFSGVRRRR